MKDIDNSLETVVQMVEIALLTNPETRNSDSSLYAEVCKKCNPLVCSMDMFTLLKNRIRFGLPSEETVSRARRKIQRENPELRASKNVEDKRFERWKEVQKWAVE